MAKENGGLEEFASQALRLGKRGSYENLLCQHLIVSVNSEPLHKIRLVAEAAFIASQDKKFQIDMETLKRIYSVCLTLINSSEKEKFISLSWAFPLTEASYENYVKPWYDEDVDLSFVAFNVYIEENKRKILEKYPTQAGKFYALTTELDLHPVGLKMLKVLFIQWSMPIVMEVFEKLSRLVQPDLYKEIFQVMKGEIAQK